MGPAPPLMTAHEYFKTPETVKPMELAFGALRVADSPSAYHQSIVIELFRALDQHVRDRQLGRMWIAPLYWLSVALTPWPGIAIQIAAGATVFAILAGAFYAGMMGGGDVKLAAALALWFPPSVTLRFLVLMSIAGGVLTLVLLVWHRAKRRAGRLEIPYGVAIAFGGLAILAQRFLNQFA